ncbi:MAG: hypothetical protein HZA93_09430 [Verrucomicrobia bacterium]|nr:hypothetical protein [Verrucomicrobiota bacterium]
MELAYESVRGDATLAEAAPPEPKPTGEPRRGGGRRPAPGNLPIERIVLDVPEAERTGLVKIREEVTEEIDYRSSQFIRRHCIRRVYAGPQKRRSPHCQRGCSRNRALASGCRRRSRCRASPTTFIITGRNRFVPGQAWNSPDRSSQERGKVRREVQLGREIECLKTHRARTDNGTTKARYKPLGSGVMEGPWNRPVASIHAASSA